MINNLNLILTQSSSHTEAPVYTVYSKQEICVDGDCDYDKVVYIRSSRSGENDELDYETFQELESAYNNATDYRITTVDSEGEQVEYPFPDDPFDDEEKFDPDEWEQKFIKLIDRFEQAFFIRQNAENYIRNNSHNLKESFIYVESAYRNSEWQAIRELLVDKALIESQDVTA